MTLFGRRLFWMSVGIGSLYLLTRLISLDRLPVFADEAIYIRWTQMMTHDPQQYLFLPMYDGKPPLFMWLLIPFLPLWRIDPLLVGRLVSVVIGGIWLVVVGKVVAILGGSRQTQRISQLISIFLPLMFFLNRMALMDGLLALLLLTTTWLMLKLLREFKLTTLFTTGLVYGLALATKTPALFYSLTLPLVVLISKPKQSRRSYIPGMLYGGVALMFGLALFGLLKFSPLFPFLFSRSEDFTFSISDLIGGQWRYVWSSLPRYIAWIGLYFSPLSIILFFYDLYTWHTHRDPINRTIVSLWLAGGVFVLPFIILGKVVASRYFLPAAVFWIPAMALGIDQLGTLSRKLSGVLLGFLILFGLWFMWPFFTNLNKVHMSHDDVQQYLTDWSAGFGIPEVRDFLRSEAQHKRVVVGTEGFFGTLPDGLFIYFDNSPLLTNLTIYGVGQPVMGLPDSLIAYSKTAETYLFVNQSRLRFDYSDCCELIATFERPLNGTAAVLLKLK